MGERILIVGAGSAGLCAAMALSGEGNGREIVLLDRDPPPPDLDPDAAFEHWQRRGVTQLRHSHVFLGRLITMLRERAPVLWEALLAAGAREFTFADSLPVALRDQYVYVPGDEDLSFLFSRRSTLDLTMRRVATTAPGVTIVTDAFVSGIDTERRDGALVVTGVRGTLNDIETAWAAGAIIDATGRTSQFPDWLAAAGVTIAEEASPAGILYFTRHYKLLDGAEEPPRGAGAGAGDLGFLKYGVFAADNRHFSVTLACPEIESGLRVALPRAEVFDATCAQMPGTAVWTDPARAAPASKVFAMGALKNAWRSFVADGAPVVRNFYPIGDAALRTNPLYGRGCSTSAMQAFVLGDVFDAIADPAARMVEIDRRTLEEIRPFFDAMVRQDKQAIKRAERERSTVRRKPRWRARLTQSFIEDGVGPASRGDLVVLRALMRPFHMLENPTAWTKRFNVMARVITTWARAKAQKADLYPSKLGPGRAEMLAALGVGDS